ncbi:MAG: L-2-amino-thiazoline-4-carboxylic acid hydrolase [Methylobacteriaceae bacterium]|nr:L-2-amino-thiazoline-4-carboxylic acid hydrolase [Methylobacteriaceae bacterium]
MQELLRRSFAMRAAFYAETYDVLRETFGRDEALRLCKQMTRRMGEKMGAAYAAHGPADIEGLKTAFLSGIIEGEALFAPELVRCDAKGLAIDFHRCPLKEAWVAQGRDDAWLEDMCEIAGAIDGGLFEAAGFVFAGETWKPGQNGCCKLRVLPGPKTSA